MSATPSFVATPKVGLVQIVNADAQNYKTLFTPGASGAKVVAIIATSSAAAEHGVQIWITQASPSISNMIGTAKVPVDAGEDGVVASVDVLANIPGLPVDNDGQPYIPLQAGQTLQVRSLTTVGSPNALYLTALGGDL